LPRQALRKSHAGITLNDRSSKMELRLDAALEIVRDRASKTHGLTLAQVKRIYLEDIVSELNAKLGSELPVPLERAFRQHSRTWLRPDGGFWYVEDWGSPRRWVLVAETKRQGTRSAREREDLPRQSRGNAIERLGKNMRGLDMLFLTERISPFVCFGEGCDFEAESSIIDRVATLNGFFPLNEVHVDKVYLSSGEVLRPASLFFRDPPWTPKEMCHVLAQVVDRSIEYFRSQYGY